MKISGWHLYCKNIPNISDWLLGGGGDSWGACGDHLQDHGPQLWWEDHQFVWKKTNTNKKTKTKKKFRSSLRLQRITMLYCKGQRQAQSGSEIYLSFQNNFVQEWVRPSVLQRPESSEPSESKHEIVTSLKLICDIPSNFPPQKTPSELYVAFPHTVNFSGFSSVR